MRNFALNSRTVVAVLLLSAAPAAAQRAPDFAAFDRYVDKAARDWKATGLAIAVVKDDSLVFAKGYGVIELGKPARVNEHTRFAIGSTTKAMTSAALAMLADEGKLQWDDKVIDYIPELRLYDAYATRELTIRDLLTHRTGLPGTDLFWGVEENIRPFNEVIRRLRYIHPNSSFRSTWNYQNVMYAMGGTIIERVSGMPWDAFIRTRIFSPLGMTESEALVTDIRGKANVAVPHSRIRDTIRAVPIRSTDGVAPAGSVWSSVSDMSKWMRFVLDSGRVGTTRLITPANFRELMAPQMRAPVEQYPALELAAPHFFSYALGWFVQDYHGRTVWMHTGSIDGMSAIIGLLPEQRVGVYVLGNLDHIELRHALMYQVFDLYGSAPSRDWSTDLASLLASKRAPRSASSAPHVASAKPSLAIERYAGTYVDSAYGNIVVTATNGALSARFEKLDLGVLEHWDRESFRSRPPAHVEEVTQLTFQVDGTGGVAAVRAFGATFNRVADASVPSRTSLEFEKTEVMIPMRDGVKLHTNIFTQKGVTEARPIILNRTPYGIPSSGRVMNGSFAELADDGYIFVFQDIRGRFASEGQFVMLRPPRDRKTPAAIDESTDTYDTIEWLIANVPGNTGKVGMLGVSYPGWLTVMAMLDPHPALKAVSPQASPEDMFIGDDFHHNGAFRLSYGFEYAAMMEAGKEIKAFAFDKPDLYDWYLDVGSLAHIDERYLRGKIPTWTDFATHASYDAFWKRQAASPYLTRVNVPTLNVAGWWDQEDFFGPIKIYETLERHDTKHLNYLVVGPWNHGGWNAATGQKLADVDFGSATSAYFRKSIQAPWFAYWLKGRGTLNLAEATTFEAGSNTWQSHDSWPPKEGVSPRKLYPQANGVLSFDAPSQRGDAYDAYVSDPAHPVPYRPRPILPSFVPPSTWSRWLMDDQRFLNGRRDVLSWQTPPLAEDVAIAGAITGHLFAATSGSDADWVVKLIDVYPDDYPADPRMSGYELMVANDVFRGRFKDGFDQPHAIRPNHVEEFTIDLHTQSYRFLKGHRIMVQVQSSWFPLIDRNPQTFVPNIFAAPDSVFKAATQKIYRSATKATYVEIPVVKSAPPIP